MVLRRNYRRMYTVLHGYVGMYEDTYVYVYMYIYVYTCTYIYRASVGRWRE